MRLPKKYAQSFKSYLGSLVDSEHELYLFGSRTDDTKKGGDIDLLLVLGSAQTVSKLKAISAKIKVKLSSLADDQKVDIVFCTKQQLDSDPFLKSLNSKVQL